MPCGRHYSSIKMETVRTALCVAKTGDGKSKVGYEFRVSVG